MNSNIQINIPFEQLISIFKQLSLPEKRAIVDELKKEDKALDEIFSGFKPSPFSDEEIFEEVEKVRTKKSCKYGIHFLQRT